jgi:UDP-N-acetylglucosamine diphosphorylase / glucose-1-phosphate thymidylyltransferase / UDP-N-acetylgalactosamine diphosphorylase / glucosamine-1-phosphate N-acetyltransferase / galactosamine-1-phosphate N-acetyltransferase
MYWLIQQAVLINLKNVTKKRRISLKIQFAFDEYILNPFGLPKGFFVCCILNFSVSGVATTAQFESAVLPYNLHKMTINLDDSFCREQLYPFSATRHVADIRIGILTIREKWALINAKNFIDDNNRIVTVAANIIPAQSNADHFINGNSLPAGETIKSIQYPWDIFKLNDQALRMDFELITAGRVSAKISSTNKIISPENIFIEAGAVVEHCIINASVGPVYIGKNAEMMEGCMVRGPFALCEGATLKMGSKIYGATTIGPGCVAGGEIKNSVLFANSNKAHDGYLGDSVIGEWCNLGGGTTSSNVKNTAGPVKVWDNSTGEYVAIGLKCGLLMGDYSRAAINTSFNTGTVVGVCCNIFGQYFPPKLVTDFTWGKERYTFAKVLQDIGNWKKLKGKMLAEAEIEILKQLYNKQ